MLGLTLEEVVGELLTDHVVKLLARLGGQAHQELVQLPRHVHQLGVEEGGGERDAGRLSPFQLGLLHQTKHNSLVTEPDAVSGPTHSSSPWTRV